MWVELSKEEFQTRFGEPPFCYAGIPFNELNSYKCEKIHYLSYGEEHHFLGIIFGEKEATFASPFSAPFGGFLHHGNLEVSFLRAAFSELKNFIKQPFKITLPPLFYERNFYAKIVSALNAEGYTSYSDINHAIPLNDGKNYKSKLHFLGPRNYRLINKLEHNFYKAETHEERALAHSIIANHYAAKGYPLWMRLEDFEATAEIIPIDFLLVDIEGKPSAASIIYRVNKQIVQLINWGYIPEVAKKRPLNLLTQKMYAFYETAGFEIFDLGPSSSQGIPNDGLSTFKESIGAFSDLKFTFFKK